MLRFPFRPPVMVGVSIQPENIHLVQLKKAKKGYLIERVRRYELPADIFSEGKIIAFESLQAKLADAVRAEGLCGVKAVVCVPANQVKMQRIAVPAGLSEVDVQAEITAQVYRTLPLKSDALAIDFQIEAAAQTEDVNVFFAAGRSEYIHRFQACVDAAGLQVSVMDVDVFALLRAVRYALQHVLCADEKICSLYLSDDYAVMAAEQGHVILFHQQWDGAGYARLAMTRMQWVEWCCHTYQQMGISSLAIGGRQELVYQAVKIMAAKWACKIYEPDPFLQMMGGSGVDKTVMKDCPSAFLLACGLAMREPMPW